VALATAQDKDANHRPIVLTPETLKKKTAINYCIQIQPQKITGNKRK